MPLSLILDILLAVLLVITIGYAVVLNRRLGALRSNKAELQELSRGFVETTKRAESGIGELRSMTEILQERIERAESLREDLIFLTERGNAAADRLEGVVRDARDYETDDGTRVQPKPQRPQQAAAADRAADAARPEKPRDPLRAGPSDRVAEGADGDGVSDAERELLKALRSAG
jgi:hypothetical protein